MTLNIVVPDLNENQINAILLEGLNQGAYETPDGALSPDKSVRERDAKDLVSLVIRASNAGNKSKFVESVLFIALVDQKPIPKQLVKEDSKVALDEWDFSQVSDKVLDQLIIQIDKMVESPTTIQQKAAFLAEKEKRQNAKGVEEVSQNTLEKEISEISSEPEGASGGTAVQESPGEAKNSAGEQAQSGTEDAGAFARVQAPEETAKGKSPAQKSPAEAGEREHLLEQINLQMLEANGVSYKDVGKLTLDRIKFIIEHPNGEEQTGPKEEDVQITAKPKDEKSIVGMDMDATAPDKQITKENLGIEIDNSGPVSDGNEREELEAKLTGPILKAYGRGRKEIPDIGVNELRLMIENPDAQVTQRHLNDARSLDNNDGIDDFGPITPSDQIDQSPATGPDNNKDISPDPVAAAKKMLEEAEKLVGMSKDLTNDVINNSEAEAAEDQRNQERYERESEEQSETDYSIESTKEELITQAAQRVSAESRPNITALEILNKEHLPIADEIEGQPPILPNDVSKCSRDEIYSLHARFHACEVRSNWIISNLEDEFGDIVKLRKFREIEVEASIPSVIDDKRTTNDYRELQAAVDSQVKEYLDQEHEKNKIVKKLKVSRDNYHLDCERLSRQMSKWEREKQDAPR